MKQLFSLPHLTNPHQNRVAVFLYKMIGRALVTLLVAAFFIVLAEPKETFRATLFILIIWSVNLPLLYFIKKGFVKTSAVIFLTSILITVFSFAFSAGGIRALILHLLPAIVLCSGIVLGRNRIWFFTFLAIFGSLILVFAEYAQWLPSITTRSNSPLVIWLFSAGSILLLCFFEYIKIGGLEQSIKETNDELMLRKQSEVNYQRIFESFQDVYFQTSLDGVIQLISPSIKERAGFDPSEIIGKNVTEFYLNPETRDVFMQELAKHGKVLNYEIDMVGKDGSVINCLASNHFIYDHNGKCVGIEGTLHDITKRKQAENSLKLQNQKLIGIAFLQSHMVRKPLVSIIGLVDLMNDENANDPINTEVLPMIKSTAKELDELIHQIVEKTHAIGDNETEKKD